MTAQDIQETLYNLMFDTYQKHITYSLRPRTVCCMESLHQPLVLIYVEN